MMIAIHGPLTFETVARWQKEVLVAVDAANEDLTIDFQSVTAVNSAALALMLEVLRRARARHFSLKFLHVPEKLISLAKVSSVDKLLAL